VKVFVVPLDLGVNALVMNSYFFFFFFYNIMQVSFLPDLSSLLYKNPYFEMIREKGGDLRTKRNASFLAEFFFSCPSVYHHLLRLSEVYCTKRISRIREWGRVDDVNIDREISDRVTFADQHHISVIYRFG